jgi:enoyl-CoA hydratase
LSILDLSRLGNCSVLTMNRPESLNAISTETLDLLESHLDTIEQDDSRALIITGTGRAFCPGTDLKKPPGDLDSRIIQVHQLLQRLFSFPKISVAAINGLALGGGLELALACTFRVAVNSAALGLPEIKIGLLPSYGGTVLLPRLIGEARAEDMMLSGESISAEQGLGIGLVNSLCEAPSEVVQSAHDFVQTYCNHSLVPQQAIRTSIREGSGLSLSAALKHEHAMVTQVATSEDCLEGVMSFIEKRKPSWKDR